MRLDLAPCCEAFLNPSGIFRRDLMLYLGRRTTAHEEKKCKQCDKTHGWISHEPNLNQNHTQETMSWCFYHPLDAKILPHERQTLTLTLTLTLSRLPAR